ncbi:lipid phosphate phosphatase epsilon 2, chloroplastic isoform X3 [Malania oleifera]|uniref:lipid phosphate phosphatase epsilon 2, chloroplastic isoform X3 n=1 Tax=Malania oleifera TaxID=397392 RepID=UPI0025ADE9A3|nr:lipid phosphate phosphatase epsilon 2, chloroplastic isoform X3 [Malania oleifera]
MLASSAISHLTFTFRPEITLYRRLKSLKSIAFPHFQASSSVFSASKRHGILIGPSIMTEVISPSFSGSSRGHEGISAFEQEHLIDESSELRSAFTCDQLESTLNRLSKWLVTGLLGVVILWRHDAEALWAAMGSVINSGLSVILKRILNQERPVSTLSGGMARDECTLVDSQCTCSHIWVISSEASSCGASKMDNWVG